MNNSVKSTSLRFSDVETLSGKTLHTGMMRNEKCWIHTSITRFIPSAGDLRKGDLFVGSLQRPEAT